MSEVQQGHEHVASSVGREAAEPKKVHRDSQGNHYEYVPQDYELLRQRLSNAERELRRIKNSTSYQLGRLVVLAVRKPGRNTIALPWRLFRLFLTAVRKKRGQQSARYVECRAQVKFDYIRQAMPVPRSVRAISSLKECRVACIMDDFTYESFRHECQLIPLTATDWQREIEEANPDLLFVESAWNGKGGTWHGKVSRTERELAGLIDWCRAHGIPTVFWNKEDPVHFDTFINTARLFDYVFTTDIDCIARYKLLLGHDRVYLLPFACQPVLHNPIQTVERKDEFCFAGAYYARYPERQRDLETFVKTLSQLRPFRIYDRNFHGTDSNYMFPSTYQKYIVGHLPPDEIDRAYKGYKFGINLNSIKYSQSMFARRVFELLASNGIVVSNFSRGLRLLFGDLVISTDNANELERRVLPVLENEIYYRKLRLKGLRKVMVEHTYADRLASVLRCALGRDLGWQQPRVTVVSAVKSEAELHQVLSSFRAQSYAHKRLIVFHDSKVALAVDAAENVIMHAIDDITDVRLGDLVSDGFVATFVPSDYYGPNYLLDLVLGIRYSEASVVGKAVYYRNVDGQAILVESEDLRYRFVGSVMARRAIAHVSVLAQLPLREWFANSHGLLLSSGLVLSVDEFNYCEDGFAASLSNSVDDLPDLDEGVALEHLNKLASAAKAAESQRPADAKQLRNLSGLFGEGTRDHVTVTRAGTGLAIVSDLPSGRHACWYAKVHFTPAQLGFVDEGVFHLDVTPGLDIRLAIILLGQNGETVGTHVALPNRTLTIPLSEDVRQIRLGLRIAGSGYATLERIGLSRIVFQKSIHVPKSDVLLVTNHYPNYMDLYRNAFVHRRVMQYRRAGLNVDVMRFNPHASTSYYEFENVDVFCGYREQLETALKSGMYRTVLVHFLDEAMWEVLAKHIEDVRLIVWLHGAEVQPWYRRAFNYQTEAERLLAVEKSNQRMRFWNRVFQTLSSNIHFVFVSQYLANEVMEDVGIRLPEDRYSIIPNFIDTNLFEYEKKPIDQRKKILSIRPFASRKYANDLTVRAILDLAKEPFFPELEFRIIGDGPLFDETVEPIRGFSNVILERRFLQQTEIAKLHKEYGVFLSPTRMDSQGVSRDEAMSSGLVPITTRVAAVPEFVDEDCGILADPEDYRQLADGIRRLYHDPALFERLSEGAANRVRRQSDFAHTIAAELKLIAT